MTDRSARDNTILEPEDMFFKGVFGESSRPEVLNREQKEKAWRDLLDSLTWVEREVVRLSFGLGYGNQFHHTEDEVLAKAFKTDRGRILEIKTGALEKLRKKVKRGAPSWAQSV